MSIVSEFHRLSTVVGLIARHPQYPGKAQVLQECLRDIESRYNRGRLTEAEKTNLVSILLGDHRHPRVNDADGEIECGNRFQLAASA
jgi:hypothetical protein